MIMDNLYPYSIYVAAILWAGKHYVNFQMHTGHMGKKCLDPSTALEPVQAGGIGNRSAFAKKLYLDTTLQIG